MGTNGSKSGTGAESPFGKSPGGGPAPGKGADLVTKPDAGMKSAAGDGHDFADPECAGKLIGAGGAQKTGPAPSQNKESIPAGGPMPFGPQSTERSGPGIGSQPSGSKAPFKVSNR